MTRSILWVLGGTGFTFLMTTLGSAMVFLFRKRIGDLIQRIFLGFAAGVMIAASIWSLLIPAIEAAENFNIVSWIPAVGGFILGIMILLIMNNIIAVLGRGITKTDTVKICAKQNILLVSAITLHNIPEGMSVGLLFVLAAQHGDNPALYAAAVALAIGVGIQNFPEGAAISLPLRHSGVSTFKAFICGSMSGIVEPIFGVLTVLIAGMIIPIMPWLLSFAAGAMMFVVVEELIPEANLSEPSNAGTLSVMFGFIVMMVLDVALG